MSSSISSIQNHVLLYAYNFYGHQKPFCALAAKIVRARQVRARRVYVTYLAPCHLFAKIEDELSRHFLEEEKSLRSRIRLVSYECAEYPFDLELAHESFTKAYKILSAGLPIPRAEGSKEVYAAIPAPTLALIDILAWGPYKCIRSISGDAVKIFVWQSIAATMIYFAAAPLKLGGVVGNLDDAMTAEESRGHSEEKMKEVANRLWYRTEGKLIKSDGLPEMYDYETYPQIPVLGFNDAFFFRHLYNLMNSCDGVLLVSSPYVEGPAIEAWKRWFGSRIVIAPGPLTPPVNAEEIEKSRKESEVFVGVEAFLNNAVDKHGVNSVVYISFGTVFWSTKPEMIYAFLDVMIELNIPVVFAHASPLAAIPNEVIKKLENSGLVYHSTWLPQQMILRHEATGWFVTHCGQNSVMEAMTEGVPLICWPFTADQPHNAANIVSNDVAYELFEVRTGEFGMRPSYRFGGRSPVGTLEAVRLEARDILTKARGEDGQAKRRKAEHISKQIAESWSDGGYCWSEMERLLSFLDVRSND